jgi:hypothetical protein
MKRSFTIQVLPNKDNSASLLLLEKVAGGWMRRGDLGGAGL